MGFVLILGVTSSTGRVGVAIGRAVDVVGPAPQAVEVLVERTSAGDRRHAEDLTPLLVEALSEAGLEATDLTRLAVDVGPGRFTGLRVGLATIRAFAFALDLDVVGVSSLELLAAEAFCRADDNGVVGAVIDARRNEVFQQMFDKGVAAGEPTVGSAAAGGLAMPAGALVVGDGADRYADRYRHCRVLTDQEPSPARLVTLAAGRVARAASSIDPLYLRAPDVQINIKTRAT